MPEPLRRPPGPPTRLYVRLTSPERAILHAWQHAPTIPVGQARRARIILLLEQGRPITQIADEVGIARRFVYKWAARFAAQGPDGLIDTRKGGNHRRRPTRAGGDDAC